MDAATRVFAGEATGYQIERADLHFDWAPGFQDDNFTFTVTYKNPTPPPPLKSETVSGTYHKSGDSLTFRAAGGTSTILQNGIVYTIVCDGKKLVLKRTGSADLVFDCGK